MLSSIETYIPTGDCNDCCMSCCCMGCTGLGYLFCVKKMRRSMRIKLFLLYLSILCVTFGVLTGTVFYGPYETNFTTTDMRLIKDRLSFIFCDGVSVDSNDGPSNTFSAYLLDSPPIIEKHINQTYKTETTSYIDDGSYINDQFYLLNGSIININICVDSIVQMYVIKGKSNFNYFINNGLWCEDCFEKRRIFYKHKRCVTASDFKFISYSVLDTDEYYIVYVSTDDSAWLTAMYSIGRTLYNVSNALDACSSVFYCEFSFDYKEPFLVIHTGDTYTLAQFPVVTSCTSRTWIYMVTFFVIPYSIGIIICVLIYRYCKDPDQTVLNIDSQASRLLRSRCVNFNFVNYQSTAIIGPPKYEEIYRTDRPPPYEEAIGFVHNN